MSDDDPMTPERAFDVYGDQLAVIREERVDLGEQRHGDAWLDADPGFLVDQMERNVGDFREIVEGAGSDEDVRAALKQLADVDNFGRMALAVARWGEDRHWIDLGSLSQQVAEVLGGAGVDADRAFLVGSFARGEDEIDQDGASDVDVYVDVTSGDEVAVDSPVAVRACGRAAMYLRDIDVFAPGHLGVDTFDEGLEKFPEAVPLDVDTGGDR